MRKWIVPGDKDRPLKLMPSWNPPKGAFCEAPDSFTSEMEPYFKLISIPQQSNGFCHSVELDPVFHSKKAEERAKAAVEFHHKNLLYKQAIDRQHEVEKYNGLKIHQRLAYNLLGKRYKFMGEL